MALSRDAARAVPAAPIVPAGRLSSFAAATFINRNFALVWCGQAVSSVGDFAFDTALVLWIGTYLAAGRSWAPLAVGGAILAAALPQVVAGPIAGVFVDRWDRRRTMLVTLALQAIVAALLVPLAAHVAGGRLPLAWQLGLIYADVAVLSTCAQFVSPAQFALIKDIVPTPKQDQALEVSQAIQGLAVILGPPIGAALVFGVGVAWALIVNALSFVVSALAVRAVQAPSSVSSVAPGEMGHFSREFRAGLGYVLGRRILRTILVSEVLTWLGFGALQALGYFYITENLHAPANAYGYLGADFGVGSIVGAVLVTLFGRRLGLARILWAGLVVAGLFVIVLSHLASFGPVLGAAFLFGLAATAIIVAAGPLVLDDTDRAFVGRVTAVINPVGRLAALISVIVASTLVSTVLRDFHATILGIAFGPVDTVFTGMGLLAVVGGLYARANLRDVG